MKILSIVLTVLLLAIFAMNLRAVYYDCYILDSPIIPKQLRSSLIKHDSIVASIYFLLVCLSLFLTLKKKYITNVVISSVMILFYLYLSAFLF